jgi:DNA polymerase-3 subunit delta
MAPPLEPAYLIGGADRGKVARAVSRLRSRVTAEGGSEERHDAGQTTAAEVALAGMALGLFAGPRLLLVDGVEAWSSADVGPLEGYLADPTPGTTLALVAGAGMRADHRLRKLLTGPRLLLFELPKGRELPAFVRKEAERVGARLEPDALRRLIDLVGEQPAALVSELEKLAAYAAGEPIDASTVDELVFAEGAIAAWAVTDALSARNRRTLYRSLERVLERGQKPQALAPQLGRHLDRLGRARQALDAGLDARAFAKQVGMHEFPARKLLDAAHRTSQAEAAAGVVRMAAADFELKGGSRLGGRARLGGPRLDPEFTLERALAELWADPSSPPSP